MVSYFINHMRVYFNNLGYHRLPLANNNIHSFVKQAQNHLYIINLYDSKLHEKDDLARLTRQFEMELYSYFDKLPIHRKFILNIIAGDEGISLLSKELSSTPIDYDSDIISISWCVDLINRKLIIPDHLPNKILGIENEINKYLNPDYNTKKREVKLKRVTNNTTITYTFIAVNILLWLSFKLFSDDLFILQYFGLNSNDLFRKYEIWRIFTSMFTHLTITHLAYNMLSLYIFGTRLEKYLGTVQFTSIYMLSGLFAGFLSAIITYISNPTIYNQIYAIGASGAIFGVIGSSLALTYSSRQEIEDLNSFTILIIAIIGILMGFADKNVDNIAHIGGLLAGFCITKFLIFPNR